MSKDANLRSINRYLMAQDPILGSLIYKMRFPKPLDNERTHFETMSRIIVGQQLSASAASVIWRRVRRLATTWKPRSVLFIPAEELRRAGLSTSKAKYVKSLCDFMVSGQMNFDKLKGVDDSQIAELLTSIKGIGPWSVEMFLIFGLRRPDVFSMSDAGLRRAIIGLYGISSADFVGQVGRITEPWRPYRSYACRYLWSSLDKQAEGPRKRG